MRRLTLVLMIGALLLTACDGRADNTVATANALATRAAGGSVDGSGDGGAPPDDSPATETPTPTDVPNLFDITNDPNALLASPWGTIYSSRVPSGDPFTIIATETQVGTYIVQTMQQGGFIDSVRGGSAQIGDGQLRVELALVDEDGDFGGGSVTFQPTLNGSELRLNPSPLSLGALDMPGDFVPAIGDAVTRTLTGAATSSLQQVQLTSISLDSGTLTIEGLKR